MFSLIIAEVAREFEVPASYLLGGGKSSTTVAVARNAVMWLARIVWQPRRSFPEIADLMLFAHHGSILDGVRRISFEIHSGTPVGRRTLAIAKRLSELDADYFKLPEVDAEVIRLESELYLKKNQQKRAHNARKKEALGG